MLESDLSKPVCDWLTARGFTPYAEVEFPRDNRTIDLVARKDADLIAIELKRSLTRSVIRQAFLCDLITDQRYAAVATRPSQKGIDQCRRSGIGLLSVRDGVVNVILQPREVETIKEQSWIRNDYASNIHRILDRMEPNGIAGVPCRKGIGPAQECFDRVQTYLTQNSAATWSEIFANVSNHYVSARSMCGAMKAVAESRTQII